MLIKTTDIKAIVPFIKKLHTPQPTSHKGQNGKLLIIGGSSLFHAASLWSAAMASRVVDMVHYCSTEENEKVFVNLKTKFVDGIVVKKKDLLSYVEEDDCILVGPGMIRNHKSKVIRRIGGQKSKVFGEIIKIKDEASYTYHLTRFLIENFPHKKFVFDAGALQMMEKDWFLKLETPPILTPHQIEFATLFGIDIKDMNVNEKKATVRKTAEKYHSVILLKAVSDIVSDGNEVVTVEGGNAGLTKGGTGDVLAGLAASLNAKNDQLISTILASFLVKKSGEILFGQSGTWYNATDLTLQIPKTMRELTAN